MTQPLEEKLCDQIFVSLGSFKHSPSRGWIFAGAKTFGSYNRGQYLHDRIEDFVIVTKDGMRPHKGEGFSLIGDRIVWGERGSGCGDDLVL